MRHGETDRIAFIASHVMAHGRIRRADIIERFGISMPQASKDIGKVLALNPALMAYDAHVKAYVRLDRMAPIPKRSSVAEIISRYQAEFHDIDHQMVKLMSLRTALLKKLLADLKSASALP